MYGDLMVSSVFLKASLQRAFVALRSNQILSRHKQTINSELSKTDEVIIHIGSNDVSKGVKPDKTTGYVHFA